MSIRSVTTDALRRMSNQEALVIQGCGGDLQEWVDGINDILTQEGILLEGTKFNDCLSFQKNDTTCLAFLFQIRPALLKSKQYYNNAFRTAVNYEDLMALKKVLKR